MPLSRSTVRELQRELGQLQKMRGDLRERINAIRALIRVEKALPSTNEAGSASSAKRARRRRKRPFRAVVLEAIKAKPGLMPRQVTALLKESGFSDHHDNQTLGTRVYKSMYKMTKQGILTKAIGGGYVVASAKTTTMSNRTT